MRAWSWTAVRSLMGAGVLVGVLRGVGPEALPSALRSVDASALVVGAAIGGVTTCAAARRWQVVARRLGVPLSMPVAVSRCYRAQLLNATLPAGVLGDVDRALGHGRDVQDVAGAARAVGWERTGGYLVLAGVTVLVAGATWASPVAPVLWAATLGPAAVAVGWAAVSRRRPDLTARLVRTAVADLRSLARPRVAAEVLFASVVVLVGHVATFVLAARVVGVPAGLTRLVPLALLVLVAGALPVNVAGWGPREGAAAWAFAGAGLGAAQGLAVAVVYGVVALVATSPGALVLLADEAHGLLAVAHRSRGPGKDRWTRPADVGGAAGDG